MKILVRQLFILSGFIIFTFTAHSDEGIQTSPTSNAQQAIVEEELDCD